MYYITIRMWELTAWLRQLQAAILDLWILRDLYICMTCEGKNLIDMRWRTRIHIQPAFESAYAFMHERTALLLGGLALESGARGIQNPIIDHALLIEEQKKIGSEREFVRFPLTTDISSQPRIKSNRAWEWSAKNTVRFKKRGSRPVVSSEK